MVCAATELGSEDVPRRTERLIRVAFVAVFAFGVALVGAALAATHDVVRALGAVAFDDADELVAVQDLEIASEHEGGSARGFLLCGDEALLVRMRKARDDFDARLARLRAAQPADPEESRLLTEIDHANHDYLDALAGVVALRRHSGADDRDATVGRPFQERVEPARQRLERTMYALVTVRQRRMRQATTTARRDVALSSAALVALALLGAVVGATVAVLLDRALVRLRAARREAARQLRRVEELNEDLDAFAGRVAHDLRNLLAPVATAPSLIRNRLHDPASVMALLDRIERAATRSLATLDGLLAFSRAQASGGDASASVAAAVDDVLVQLGPLAEEARVSIERDIEDARVACPRELLTLVLSNVVGNAIKYVAGSEPRRVFVTARADASGCELVVRDTGPGIPVASLPHVFEPFYRVPGTHIAGTGIGLATVRRVVEAHGGHVSAEASDGTTIRIRLPLAATERKAGGSQTAVASSVPMP